MSLIVLLLSQYTIKIVSKKDVKITLVNVETQKSILPQGTNLIDTIVQTTEDVSAYKLLIEHARLGMFEVPLPKVELPDSTFPLMDSLETKLTFSERINLSELLPRVYIIYKPGYESEAYFMHTQGDSVAYRKLPPIRFSQPITVAFVMNVENFNVEIRIYKRGIEPRFIPKYSFYSVPSGFAKQPIVYCLSFLNRPEDVLEESYSIMLEGLPVQVDLKKVHGNVYCASVDVDTTGIFKAYMKASVSFNVDGATFRAEFEDSVYDTVKLIFLRARMPKDRGIKYGKEYSGEIFLKAQEPLKLIVQDVITSTEDLEFNVSGEYEVSEETAIPFVFKLRKGADKDGSYFVRIFFKDDGERSYFLTLKLLLGKSAKEDG